MAKNGLQSLNSLVRDQDRVPIQIGSSFQTEDATSTPQTSPLSYTASTTNLVVPDNAVEFVCQPTTALRISENSDMTPYDVIASNTKEAIPCARMSNIYITRDSSSGTLNFRFTLV